VWVISNKLITEVNIAGVRKLILLVITV